MTSNDSKENKLLPYTFEQLACNIITVDETMYTAATKAINQTLSLRNWIIGAYIIEYEQKGLDRAQYGDGLLKRLEATINKRGLTVTIFQLSRLFYRAYPQVASIVCSKYETSHILPIREIYDTVYHKSQEIVEKDKGKEISSTKFVTRADLLISKLSFSHIRELLYIEDPLVRFFYETECIKGTWSVRELHRQIVSQLHIRVGLSINKLKALQQTQEKAEKDTLSIQIHEPYTFEFLGLKSTEVFNENDLKTAIVNHLQEFLLEMGKGFCFEAREKRIIIDDEYYFADLVLYNRILHCNVIAEVKVDEFRHEHMGQLNAYVSYYAENEMNPGDNPPIGILLCTKKGKKMVEYALGNLDQQLFVSTYQLQLPNPQELEQLILKECQEER